MNKNEKETIYLQAVESYAGRLYNVAYFILKDKRLAEDAVQEAYKTIWLNLDKFSFKSSIYTWMYKIVYNTSINIYNKEQKHSYSELENEKDFTENHIDKITLNEAINILSINERQSIIMYYFTGYKIREISEKLQVNENTVKSWLKRSKEKMRGYFNE